MHLFVSYFYLKNSEKGFGNILLDADDEDEIHSYDDIKLIEKLICNQYQNDHAVILNWKFVN